MPITYNKIASVTVGSGGAASIEFTGIPATFTDLKLVLCARNDAATTVGGFHIQFNSSTSNLSCRFLFGTGSTAGSSSDGTAIFGYTNAASSTASTFSNGEIYIPNYAGSTNKSVSIDSVMETNATGANMALTAGLWSQTAAITSLKLVTFNNSTSAAANFVQHSTATLYGIKKD
jgi:hypothetical protein